MPVASQVAATSGGSRNPVVFTLLSRSSRRPPSAELAKKQLQARGSRAGVADGNPGQGAPPPARGSPKALNVQWSANHTFLDPGTPEAANTDAAAEPGAQPPAALTVRERG